jgi:glycosyltransferase involved in cell wall biosynthesis
MASLRRRRHESVAAKGAIIFSMQDIFNSFAVHATASGIQRVQAGIALKVIADNIFDAHFVINGEPDNGVPTFLRIENKDLLGILTYAAAKQSDHVTLKQMLVLARFRAVPLTFGAGTTVVILGSFWDTGNGIDQFIDARRRGVRIIPFIHDIIPITHPEYCDTNLASLFWRTLSELIYASDYVLTNSDFTQFELKRFIAENGGRQMPMCTIPLAHSMMSDAKAASVWPRALSRVKGRRYVVMSPRSRGVNHLFVVKAWQAMISQGIAVPDLIFVGRKGWKIDSLTQLLNDTKNLNGKIHIVHDLSDAELNGVYAHAMFTLFTSVVEGWGLPVGESLAHGVPCVVTRAASLPEVGGDFADYITPDDQDGALRVLQRFIEDPSYLTERRQNIQNAFATRTWEDVGQDFTVKLQNILEEASAPSDLPPVTLKAGAYFRPGEFCGRVNPLPGYVANPVGLMLAESFYRAESGAPG